jgi:uncharacterized membrane protein
MAVAFSAIIYGRLPEQMASHWNANDQVNGYMSRFWGAFLMPIISTGMLALFLIIPSIDPLKDNITKFRDTFNTFIALIIAFMLYTHILTLIYNLGYTFRISLAMIPGLGLIFVFAGIMMSKAKRNYFIGIRTPWTLANDTVWDETHKLGSKLFIGAGVLSLFSLFLGENGFWLMMILLGGAGLIPVIYSYILFARITNQK